MTSPFGPYRFFVFSNPADGKEEEFERWYDEQHVPDLFAIPGFVSAQRFRLTDAQARKEGHPHRYLVVYEIDTDDLQGVFDEIVRRRGDGRIVHSDAFDTAGSVTHTYEPVTARVTPG